MKGNPIRSREELAGLYRRHVGMVYQIFISCFVPPEPEVVLTAEEETKAQKALAARNRERE